MLGVWSHVDLFDDLKQRVAITGLTSNKSGGAARLEERECVWE